MLVTLCMISKGIQTLTYFTKSIYINITDMFLLKRSHFYTYSANSIKTVQKWFQYKFASILITVSWQINITFEQLTKEIQQ